MTARMPFCLLLFLTGCCDCMLRGTISPFLRRDATRYCHISANHTMCQFPYDVPGTRCSNFKYADLDERDIQTILDWHNIYRNTVANGEEQRGNPGPQRPAKYMMELTWDDELAYIARRWASQCKLFEKDQCRDVERFQVWQNVHVLDMNGLGNITSSARIHFHIQSWYDEVEEFDSAEFGFFDFEKRTNLSYVAFSSSSINFIGCGRAIYSTKETIRANVEGLVCNYGPQDRTTPGVLYEDGAPVLCPPGTIRSERYPALCQKFEQWSSRKVHRRTQPIEEKANQEITSGTFLIKKQVGTIGLLASLLICLST